MCYVYALCVCEYDTYMRCLVVCGLSVMCVLCMSVVCDIFVVYWCCACVISEMCWWCLVEV